MPEPQEVEILAHIAAPSKASDDAHYRLLATAYIDFQPGQRFPLYVAPDLPPDNGQDIHGSNLQSTAHYKPYYGSQLSMRSQEFLPSLKSPDASFRSVLDNAHSPRHPPAKPTTPSRAHHGSQEVASPSSWQTPSSVVQDSFPENDVTARLFTSPTRILEHYLQHFQSSDSGLGSGSGSREDSHSTGQEALPSGHSFSSNDSDNADIIPCTPVHRPPLSSIKLGGDLSQPSSRPSSQARRDKNRHSPSNNEDFTVILAPDSFPTARAESEPLPMILVPRECQEQPE